MRKSSFSFLKAASLMAAGCLAMSNSSSVQECWTPIYLGLHLLQQEEQVNKKIKSYGLHGGIKTM